MPATDHIVRPATAADIPALHALVESAYRGDSARRGWTHEADMLGGQRTDTGELASIIVNKTAALLVVEADGALIGCVHLKPAGRTGTVYLGLFAVAPDRQASGLGKALLAAAEHHAEHAMSAQAIEMTVIRQREELIAWYERRGYGRTGEGRPFPHDDARFGLPNRRDLSFVVLEKRLDGTAA